MRSNAAHGVDYDPNEGTFENLMLRFWETSDTFDGNLEDDVLEAVEDPNAEVILTAF